MSETPDPSTAPDPSTGPDVGASTAGGASTGTSRTPILTMLVGAVLLLLAGVVAVVVVDDDADVDVAGAASEETADDDSGDDGTGAATDGAGARGEGDGDDDGLVGGTPSTSPAEGSADASTPTTAAGGTTGGAPGAGAGGASPTTTAAPATTATTAPAPTGSAPFGTTATAAGSYTYDTTGTIDGEPVEETSVLTVPAPDAQGRQAQVLEGPDGRTTTTYRFTTEGTYLEELRIESDQGSFTLRAEGTFLLVPAGAGPGTVTTGRLSGDGLAADVRFEVRAVGAEEATARLDADISGEVSGVQVDGTQTSTITVRSADQLTLVSDSESELSAGGFFTTTSDLRSVLRR